MSHNANLALSAEVSVQTQITAHKRKTFYWLTFVIIAGSYLFMLDSSWRSSGEFHTVLEVIAMLLAFIVGAIALVEYHSRKDVATLFVGAGFFGTGALDCYHAIVTSSYFQEFLPSGIEALIPWSWVASRLFLSVMLCLGCYYSILAKRQPEKTVAPEKIVFIGTALLTLGCFAFFAFVPLPPAYYPELPFHRPEEFVPAFFFLAALIGFYHKGDWRTNNFEHWLLLSLMVDFICQAVYMAFSGTLFDIEFDVAHILKCVSYLLMLTGLLYNIHVSFSSIHQEMRVREITEEELRYSQIRKSAIIDSMADGLIIVDSEGTIEEANASTETIFERPLNTLNGLHISALLPDGLEQINTAGTSDTPAIPETTATLKDGSSFPVSLSIASMNLGRHTKYSIQVRDISQQKAQEAQMITRQRELENTNAELEKFAYIASHDLQEPLRKVTAFADRLQKKYAAVLDERGQDYLQRMVSATARMQILISDLLSFSRLSTTEMKLEPYDLNKIVSGVIDDLEVRINQSKASVHKPELPILNCNPPLIRQLFQNLLSNALKFQRPDTPPIISINCENIGQMVDNNGVMRPWCRIEVKDNGIGFADEYREKIFEIFQRLHNRSEYEGTGMGLAIVRKIIDRHGGRIDVSSTEGKGSSFVLTLPLSF